MPSVRRVYKFATGQPLPPGAIYLCTKVQELPVEAQVTRIARGEAGWLVWHYYEVLTDEAGNVLSQAALADELAGA